MAVLKSSEWIPWRKSRDLHFSGCPIKVAASIVADCTAAVQTPTARHEKTADQRTRFIVLDRLGSKSAGSKNCQVKVLAS